jgi:hypothetical protein
MFNHLRGVYKHLRTSNLYFVDGFVRDVTNPNKISVVYTQLYESKLNGTDIKLPHGSMWIRNIDDFQNKFEKVYQSKPEKFITSIRIALEKDILYEYNKESSSKKILPPKFHL